MPILLSEECGGELLKISAIGQLSREDYGGLMSELERKFNLQQKVNILVDLKEFGGWDAGGLWEELRGEAKFSSVVRKCALVGGRQWVHVLTALDSLLSPVEVRYFDQADLSKAHEWAREGAAAGRPLA